VIVRHHIFETQIYHWVLLNEAHITFKITTQLAKSAEVSRDNILLIFLESGAFNQIGPKWATSNSKFAPLRCFGCNLKPTKNLIPPIFFGDFVMTFHSSPWDGIRDKFQALEWKQTLSTMMESATVSFRMFRLIKDEISG